MDIQTIDRTAYKILENFDTALRELYDNATDEQLIELYSEAPDLFRPSLEAVAFEREIELEE